MPVHEVYRDGVVISRVETPATIDDIKAEAQRRIIALCGAETLEGALIKQINVRADPAEESLLNAGIAAIRAASNLIEADPPIDVSADPRWP